MKQLIRPILVGIARTFLKLLDEAQTANLRPKFKSCGRNLKLFYPANIYGAENIVLGDDVSIGAFTNIWGQGGVQIGNRVMIASNNAITTYTHDHSARCMKNTLVEKKVVIEDDVWICAHVTILPGITLGEGCVVGAGAVVTKSVEPFSIVVGNPARLLKYREIASRQGRAGKRQDRIFSNGRK